MEKITNGMDDFTKKVGNCKHDKLLIGFGLQLPGAALNGKFVKFG